MLDEMMMRAPQFGLHGRVFIDRSEVRDVRNRNRLVVLRFVARSRERGRPSAAETIDPYEARANDKNFDSTDVEAKQVAMERNAPCIRSNKSRMLGGIYKLPNGDASLPQIGEKTRKQKFGRGGIERLAVSGHGIPFV